VLSLFLTLVFACGGEVVEESPASKTVASPDSTSEMPRTNFIHNFYGHMRADARVRGGNLHRIFGVRWQHSHLDQTRRTRPSSANFRADVQSRSTVGSIGEGGGQLQSSRSSTCGWSRLTKAGRGREAEGTAHQCRYADHASEHSEEGRGIPCQSKTRITI
jgi:hypothetical protein